MLFELQPNFDENVSCTNFVLQDGGVEGYWGNEHIFNTFPIFVYICFFLSPFSTRMVFKKINAHLIMQETQVLSLIREDSTCHRATRPVCHDHWTHVLQLLKSGHPRAHALQWEKPQQREAREPQLEISPCSLQLEKSPRSTQNPAQPKYIIN